MVKVYICYIIPNFFGSFYSEYMKPVRGIDDVHGHDICRDDDENTHSH